MSEPIRLTQYSHGAGCGCKISPQVLEVILAGSGAQNLDPKLWVGNASRDDAAVYALDDERGVVSTTDFLCRSSMTLTISAVLPPPMPSATSMQWA
jgi:Selenophosphate synthase